MDLHLSSTGELYHKIEYKSSVSPTDEREDCFFMPYKDPEKQKEYDRQKKAKAKAKSKQSRTRNFATILYPESAPANWRDIIAGLHVPVLVSPLHDKDTNPDGTQKKPHYHVLFMFDTVKNWESQIKPLFDSFGGVGREIVNSARGYARYLCHLDNPEKAQYNPNDILAFGGADYLTVTHLPTDDIAMLKDIFAYIRANNIFSLSELLDICAINNPDWFMIISTSRAYIVDKYIKSLKWEKETNYKRVFEV